MTKEEAMYLETQTPTTFIERNGVYYEVPVWMKEDLEAVEIIKKNAKLSCKFAKECDKDGHLSGIFAVLEAVLKGKELETIEKWLERKNITNV